MSKHFRVVLFEGEKELASKVIRIDGDDLPASKLGLMMKAKEIWRDILFNLYGERWREHETDWGSFWK